MSEEEMKKEENFEHEVIDRLKNLGPMDFDYNALDASYVDAMLKARNIILDLYNKQKEKNKAIEVARKDLPKDVELVVVTKEDFERNFGSEYISKDKIKAKIEELENIKLCGDKFYKHLTEMKIKVLQELLEE